MQPPQSTDKKQDSNNVINDHVDGNITHLTLSALSAALGDIRIFKLVVTNKNSPKYIPVTDPQEIILALQYIARFSNTLLTPASLIEAEQDYSYFILQQSPINTTAWNALIDRRLGKIPQETKLDVTTTFDLEVLGQKAIEARKRQMIDATPHPTLPTSWVTPE